jgi:hypothetical protein
MRLPRSIAPLVPSCDLGGPSTALWRKPGATVRERGSTNTTNNQRQAEHSQQSVVGRAMIVVEAWCSPIEAPCSRRLLRD